MTINLSKSIILTIIIVLIICSCTHVQNAEKNQPTNKIIYANSEQEITDSFLIHEISKEITSNDCLTIRSNIDYEKQILCEKLGDTLIQILKIAEKSKKSLPFSLNDAAISNANIDSISPIDSLNKFALCDIVLLNTLENKVESLVIRLNEIDSLDYSTKVNNLCLYPIAINEGIIQLNEDGYIDSDFYGIFSMESFGNADKSVINNYDKDVFIN